MYIDRLQDAWADKFGTFPTGGGTVEKEEMQALFLIAMADGIRSGEPCEVGPECEACFAIKDTWWGEVGRLDRRVRWRLFMLMETLRIDPPSGVVRSGGTHALSASLN
jgi:hypothetical protein